MAALLRSGKLFRLVSGIARNATVPNVNSDALPLAFSDRFDDTYSDLGLSKGKYNNLPSTCTAFTPFVQKSLTFLDALDVDGKQAELYDYNSVSVVTKTEIEEMLNEISSFEPAVASSQAMFILCLCNKVDEKDRGVFISDVLKMIYSLDNVQLETSHFNTILRLNLENCIDFNEDNFINEMHSRGAVPDAETYTTLIGLNTRLYQTESALKYFRTIQKDNLRPNEDQCEVLLSSLLKMDLVDEAKALLDYMNLSGYNVFNTNNVLSLGKRLDEMGDIDGMAECLNFILSQENDIRLSNFQCSLTEENNNFSKTDNVVTSNNIFGRLILGNHPDLAYRLLCAMLVDESSVVVMKFMCEINHLDYSPSQKLDVISGMEHRGVITDGVISLLNFALKSGNIILSLTVASNLIEHKRELTSAHFSALMNMIIAQTDLNTSPPPSSLNLFINLLSRDQLRKYIVPPLVPGDDKQAFFVLEKLQSWGLPINIALQPLIEFLIDSNCVEDAKVVARSYKEFLEPHLYFLAEEKEEKANDTIQSSSSEIRPDCLISTSEVDQLFVPQEYETRIALPISGTPAFQIFELRSLCEIYYQQGNTWALEDLLFGENCLKPSDRQTLYLFALRLYAAQGRFYNVVDLMRRIESEGLHYDFSEYHEFKSDVCSHYAPLTESGAFVPIIEPTSLMYDTSNSTVHAASIDLSTLSVSDLYKQLRHHLSFSDSKASLDISLLTYQQLESQGRKVNISDSSLLIEYLTRADRLDEATNVTLSILMRHGSPYPSPKVFRFLLNKLAAAGDVESMLRLEPHLLRSVKQDVSFDNRMCNAYIIANRGADFLRSIDNSLKNATTSEALSDIKMRFPRGGAMGLLQAQSDLVDEYTELAKKFAAVGYIAPINVLWSYHFINHNHELALPLWNDYVKHGSQIMFQKVCQTARSRTDVKMALTLVELLSDTCVSNGALGIAYSCLIDVLISDDQSHTALEHIRQSLNKGINLKDLNRTALHRLKQSLEKNGEQFPFEIPTKCDDISLIKTSN